VHDAYLADVAVEPGSRGRGIRKVLMRTMVEDGPGPGFRWTLFTSDAPDRTAVASPDRLPLSGRPVRSGGGMSAAAQRRRCKRSHDANAWP
jgi:GNAT superfamily N-acetyltransferase